MVYQVSIHSPPKMGENLVISTENGIKTGTTKWFFIIYKKYYLMMIAFQIISPFTTEFEKN